MATGARRAPPGVGGDGTKRQPPTALPVHTSSRSKTSSPTGHVVGWSVSAGFGARSAGLPDARGARGRIGGPGGGRGGRMASGCPGTPELDKGVRSRRGGPERELKRRVRTSGQPIGKNLSVRFVRDHEWVPVLTNRTCDPDVRADRAADRPRTVRRTRD